MTGRERVERALHFKKPDRLPLMHRTLIGGWSEHRDELSRLYKKYPSDFVSLAFDRSGEYGPRAGERHLDAWGAVWLRLGDQFKGQVVGHPLQKWSSLDTYRFPDPSDTDEFEILASLIESEGHEKYILVDGGTLFQRMFYLRGFDNILIDLVSGEKKAVFLRDRIMEHILGRINCWLEAGVDGVSIRDDWGSQDRLLVSPELWRTLFKPCYRKICEAVHRGGANAHLHTDGFTLPIIPDLIEAGFDELNPQLSAMGMDELSDAVRGKVCIRSDVDRQRLLPRGTPKEVERYVERVVSLFATPNGGLIGFGEVSAEVPLENTEAMLQAFSRYGARVGVD